MAERLVHDRGMLENRANRTSIETASNDSMQHDMRVGADGSVEMRLPSVLLERADIEMALVAGFTMAEVAFMLDLATATDPDGASAEAGCDSNVSVMVRRYR